MKDTRIGVNIGVAAEVRYGFILRDVRYGVRVLGKNPGFTAVVGLTLSLGIGANSSIFYLLSAVILRPLPYPNPEQLVGLGRGVTRRAGRPTSRDLQTQTKLKAGVSIPQVQAALDDLVANLARAYPAADKGCGFELEPLQTPIIATCKRLF